MTQPPTTKPELMDLIRERWAALQGVVSPLSAEDLERPLGDGWSAKVHVAHLAAWEVSLMALLRQQDRAQAMGISPATWEAREEADSAAINDVIARRAEPLPVAQVVAESSKTHADLMALLDSLTQEDLEKPYSHYQPDDPPYNSNPVGGWVHGNTWDHYNEHIGWLRAGLGQES